MRLLICGSRDWTDRKKMDKWVDWAALGAAEPITVIEGCALGADRMGEQVATDRGYALEHHPADWKRYGKGAGPIRNRQMLLDGKPDLVLAFHKNNSKGTQHMVDIATAAGVLVRVVK